MPFTLSDPAAVLPLARCGLPLSALVVGSMMPDLPYFVFLSTDYQFGHSLAGIFYFCVPVGLLILQVFHCWITEPSLSLLPSSHRRKLRLVAGNFTFWPLPRLLKVCIALAVGALTHVAWDSFTHANGWMVLHWPLLNNEALRLPIYKFLQHGGTIVGFGLLALFYRRWWRSAPESDSSEPQFDETLRRRWMAGGALLLIAFASVEAVRMLLDLTHLQFIVRDLAIVGMALLAAEWMFFCVWWHWRPSRTGAEPENRGL